MAAGKPLEIKSDLLLLHEGVVDLNVIGSLNRHHELQAGFQFLNLEGQSKLRQYLKALALSPHFKSPVPGYPHPVRGLAVVIDAETDAARTFQAVCDALNAAGLPVPSAPGGTVVGGGLKVGVFLVPDNVSPGKIETLCLRSVEADPAWHCLDLFFQCVQERGGTPPFNMDKARAQAFLSTRSQPDLPVGLAADEGYWNLGHAAFVPLVGFLRAMSA